MVEGARLRCDHSRSLRLALCGAIHLPALFGTGEENHPIPISPQMNAGCTENEKPRRIAPGLSDL
jgi:hypothetical protein